MCFRINNKAPRRRAKYGYKLVRVMPGTGVVRSAIFSGYTWHTGEHKIRKGAKTVDDGVFFVGDRVTKIPCANEGIYIYTSKKAALDFGTVGEGFLPLVLMKVQVEPKDHLYTSKCGRMATYRKVIVPEDQPEIEWY